MIVLNRYARLDKGEKLKIRRNSTSIIRW